MEWTRETRQKLALKIRLLSLEIQEEEMARQGKFPEMVEKTIERIMERLEPLGFTKAKGWFQMESGDWADNLYTSTTPEERTMRPDTRFSVTAYISNGKTLTFQESPTHLWFETAQARIVTISKEDAEKILVLGLP